MIPAKTHPGWSDLVSGKVRHEFKTLSASLMLSRLSREYKADPTPAKMSESIDKAHEFFTRFEALFQEDLKVIFQ